MKSALEAMVEEGRTALAEELKKRLAQGEEEYGKLTWLQADTVSELMEEVADIINWASFTWIKLHMLQKTLDAITAKHRAAQQAGIPEGFMSMGDLYGQKS